MAVTLIFKNRERQRHGSGVASKLIPQSGDAPGVFIYSEGGMEQEEMDYIVEAEAEKARGYKRMTPTRKVGIETNKDGSHTLDIKET